MISVYCCALDAGDELFFVDVVDDELLAISLLLWLTTPIDNMVATAVAMFNGSNVNSRKRWRWLCHHRHGCVAFGLSDILASVGCGYLMAMADLFDVCSLDLGGLIGF